MKLSMMSSVMSSRGFAFDKIVDVSIRCGFDGIDVVQEPGLNASDVKKLCADAELPVAGHIFFMPKFLAGDSNWLDDAERGIAFAHDIGAPLVMIPTMTNPNIPRSEFRKRWIGALAEVAPVADKAGMILTIENYPGEHSAFVIADDFFEAQRQIPQLRLTYDNGNATSGENAVESFLRCREYVVHAHFKDWNISDTPSADSEKMLDGRYYKYTLIGEGDVDTSGCWRAMRDAGYSGFINIESIDDRLGAEESFRRIINHLRFGAAP